MLTEEPTSDMINEWKRVYRENKDKLKPNKKSGDALLEYLNLEYILIPKNDDLFKNAVMGNIKGNEYFNNKLSPEENPKIVAFEVSNEGNGKILYEKQDEVFKGIPIIVGIEINSGYYMVEGSSMLWDEICAFMGLDEADIENYFLVYQYVTALKKNKKEL